MSIPAPPRRVLILDIDGVIGNLMSATSQAINRQFGTRYEVSDVVEYSLAHLTAEESSWIQDAWYSTPILGELPVYPEFMAVYPSLISGFDQVIVATDRKAEAYDITERWLAQIGIIPDQLFVQFGAKLAALATLPEDCEAVLIDDRPIPPLLAEPRLTTFVPDRHWNQGPDLDPFRFFSYAEVLGKLALCQSGSCEILREALIAGVQP